MTLEEMKAKGEELGNGIVEECMQAANVEELERALMNGSRRCASAALKVRPASQGEIDERGGLICDTGCDGNCPCPKP